MDAPAGALQHSDSKTRLNSLTGRTGLEDFPITLAPLTLRLTEELLRVQTLEKALMWQRLRQMSEEGAPVEALVESVRPAGLIVRLEGSDITGFVPGSHIMQVHSVPRHNFSIRVPCLIIKQCTHMVTG